MIQGNPAISNASVFVFEYRRRLGDFFIGALGSLTWYLGTSGPVIEYVIGDACKY
jgi:hypothetical protein